MRIFCGGETGLVKVVDPEKQETITTWGKQGKDKCVSNMVWGNPGQESEIVLTFDDGAIESYFANTGQLNFQVARSEDFIKNHAKMRGLYCENVSDAQKLIVVCSEKGQVELHKFSTTTRGRSNESESGVTTFNVQAPVGAMKACKSNSSQLELAITGKDNLLKVYDVTKQQPIYKVKNLKPDWLEMQYPVWDRDVVFLDPYEGGNLLATCTAYHQIRVYDRRIEGKRPIVHKHYGEYSFTTIANSPRSSQECFIGEQTGNMFLFDFEAKERKHRLWASYKGNAGAVRDIMVDPSGKHIASVSADRYVRVFDVKTRQVAHSMYLIQRQSRILFAEDPEERKKREAQEAEEAEQAMDSVEEEEEDEEEEKQQEPSPKKPKKKTSDDDLFILGDDLDEEDFDSDDEIGRLLKEQKKKDLKKGKLKKKRVFEKKIGPAKPYVGFDQEANDDEFWTGIKKVKGLSKHAAQVTSASTKPAAADEDEDEGEEQDDNNSEEEDEEEEEPQPSLGKRKRTANVAPSSLARPSLSQLRKMKRPRMEVVSKKK